MKIFGRFSPYFFLGCVLVVGMTCYFVGFKQGLRSRSVEPVSNVIHVKQPTSGRVPGEFEHQDALLVGFNELVEFYPRTLVEIVRAIENRIRIIGLVVDEGQKAKVQALLASHNIHTSNIEYFIWPARMMWVQDYGPIFVVNGDATIIDFNFRPPNTELENMLPMAFAAHYGFSIDHARMSLEGGNLLSNGSGLCVSTINLMQANADRKLSLEDIGSRLQRYFRFDQWAYVQAIAGEPTAHVDVFATFTAPDVIVVGAYDSAEDPTNSAILDANAAALAKVQTSTGPLRVERIQNAPHRNGKWRTCTNVIYANGVLLVPQYPDVSPDRDRAALALYQKLLPDWKVVGIDTSDLIAKRGALHCISLNIPKLPPR